MFTPPHLERSPGFQLKLLQVSSEARAQAALEPFDISPARVAALMIIDANPGCTQTALGGALAVNRASAMKLVNFLEGRGLVRRSPSPDPRANALYVTESGAATLREMTKALELADRDTLAPLSSEEAAVFRACIAKMRGVPAARANADPG
jgi:DNA-binding MarR family transcriptional regulator